MSSDLNHAPRPVVAACFLLDAEAAPGLLPRLLQPFAKRDLTPDRLSAQRVAGGLRVEIAVVDVDGATLSLIEGNLRQVVGVRQISRGASLLQAA